MNQSRTSPTRPGPEKVFFAGTHRVRHPDHTWEIIGPKASDFGITRIADVTGLDSIGIPVAMSVRPTARTLSVSQGKGQTYELARVSAMMEAIELWHVENATITPVHRGVPGTELGLTYRVESVTSPGSLISGDTPIDWLPATGLLTGAEVPVPKDLVLPAFQQSWTPFGFKWSSNGLASGNTSHEALLHALYEIVERDAVCAEERQNAVPIDPESVDDMGCSMLIEQVRTAADLEIHMVPNRFGTPTFGASIWSTDFPVICRGWGTHSDCHIALSRAITEAAQSRLTAIAGSRDDLPPIYEHVRSGADRTCRTTAALSSLSSSVDNSTPSFLSVADEVEWLCTRISRVLGNEPLMVDLSTDDQFSVVRAVVPGASFDIDIVHPRG